MPDIPIPPKPVIPEPLVLPEVTTTGAGRIDTLWINAARFGSRGVIVHGHSLDRSGRLAQLMRKCPPGTAAIAHAHAGGEPTLDQVETARRIVRDHRATWVAAIGGGSVIDLAKSAAGLCHAPGDVESYHNGQPPDADCVPIIAAPTTAGTGSEATINAVLTNTRTGSKKSIRDPRWMPRVVILDSDLLAGCPPAIVAHSGLDALTQAAEAFISRHATWFSDTIALQAVRMIAGALPRVVGGAGDPARQDLLVGSYLAGMALAQARLGIVHGIAHPLGVAFHAPHGQVCALCLPHALALNRPFIGDKYERLSGAVGGDIADVAAAMVRDFRIESPFAGQSLPGRETIIAETLASGSTKANPKTITRADVEWLLDRLFTTR